MKIYVDECKHKKHTIKYIGTEQSLISYLARHYIVLDNGFPIITINRAFNYKYWDNNNQNINPYDYQEDSWKNYYKNIFN